MKQILPENNNHHNFVVNFTGIIALRLKKSWLNFFQVSIHFHPCHPLQQMTGNSFRAKLKS